VRHHQRFRASAGVAEGQLGDPRGRHHLTFGLMFILPTLSRAMRPPHHQSTTVRAYQPRGRQTSVYPLLPRFAPCRLNHHFCEALSKALASAPCESILQSLLCDMTACVQSRYRHIFLSLFKSLQLYNFTSSFLLVSGAPACPRLPLVLHFLHLDSFSYPYVFIPFVPRYVRMITLGLMLSDGHS
jgi:hypothetical protein